MKIAKQEGFEAWQIGIEQAVGANSSHLRLMGAGAGWRGIQVGRIAQTLANGLYYYRRITGAHQDGIVPTPHAKGNTGYMHDFQPVIRLVAGPARNY